MTPTSEKSEERTQFTLRLRPSIIERISQIADARDDSRNQVIEDACKRLIAECDAHGWQDPGGRARLELPGGEDPPAFQLVGPSQTAPQREWTMLVDGVPVPHVKVVEMFAVEHSDGFTLSASGPDSYQVVLDDRFAIMVATYDELWRWGWFLANAMAVAAGRPSHRTEVPPQVIEEGWRVMDEAGMCGHTYEVTATFGLPAMADGDQWAFGARDEIIKTLSQLGARDVVTRLISLTGMEVDRRVCVPAD